MAPSLVIVDGFEIVRPLARGGMADIFEAYDRERRRVVLKVLREGLSKDPEVVRRFEREARVASNLASRHTVRILDVGATDNKRPYIVMEYLHGHDLGKELSLRDVLPLEEAASYLAQACHSMIEAHEAGVVHRDLKPANLFLVDEDGKRTLKVLDFGISKVTRGPTDGNATLTEALFGSPLYMSPETFRSAKAADVRSDIWSLGVIFYEMLTGVQPFVAEHAMAVGLSVTREAQIPPSQRRANLPRATDVVVERALKKNPDERYQSVREMLAALEVFLPRGRNDTMTLAQVVAPEGDDDPRTLRKDDAHITKLGMIAPASDARASEPDPTEAPTRVQAETAGETGKNFSRPVSDSTPPPAATLSRQKRLPMAAWLVPLVAVVFGVGGFLIASRGASTSSVPAAPATIETTAPARLESPVAETTPTPSAETSAAPIPSATDLPTEVDEVSVEAEPATTPNGAASPKWAPKRNPKKKQPAFVPKGI